MFRYINDLLINRSKQQLIIISAVLILMLGITDYLSGYELSFSIFYLAPVAIACWYIDKYTGVMISVFSAVVWLVVDNMSGHKYSNQLFIFWNVAVRMCFFLITTYLLIKIKTDLSEKALQSRMDSLTGIMNLRAFEEIYNHIIKLSLRNNHPFY